MKLSNTEETNEIHNFLTMDQPKRQIGKSLVMSTEFTKRQTLTDVQTANCFFISGRYWKSSITYLCTFYRISVDRCTRSEWFYLTFWKFYLKRFFLGLHLPFFIPYEVLILKMPDDSEVCVRKTLKEREGGSITVRSSMDFNEAVNVSSNIGWFFENSKL